MSDMEPASFWAGLGDILSKHTTWTALIGIVTAMLTIWTFYKDFWERPNIKVYAGDSIDFVKSTDYVVRKLHISCTFTNNARKAGIVTKVALIIKPDGGNPSVLEWQMFYRYEGGHNALPDSKVCPIPVPGNQSMFQGIEFELKDAMKWDAGVYRVKVVAWIDQDVVSESPTVSDEFSIIFTNGFVADLLSRNTIHVPSLHTVMIQGREISPDNLKGEI